MILLQQLILLLLTFIMITSDQTLNLCVQGVQQSPIQILQSKTRIDRNISFNIQWIPAQIRYNPNQDHALHFQGQISRIQMQQRNRQSQIYEAKQFNFYVPAEHKLTTIQPDIEMQILYQNQKGQHLIYSILFVKSILKTNPLSVVSLLSFQKNNSFLYNLNLTKELKTDSMGYSYMGSFNYYPCSQNVRYLIKREMIILSDQQYTQILDRSRELNISRRRGMQKLNDRMITLNSVKYEANGIKEDLDQEYNEECEL